MARPVAATPLTLVPEVGLPMEPPPPPPQALSAASVAIQSPLYRVRVVVFMAEFLSGMASKRDARCIYLRDNFPQTKKTRLSID
jgi:hypothetical protein